MSFRTIARIAALVSACLINVGPALAENRIALVIGNASYASVNPLVNPTNDAKAMAEFLSTAGFQVLQGSDLKHSAMLRTIGKFADLLATSGPDTVALVFYAGHGLQVDGENYLVPVDAAIHREADVPLYAMRLADLMSALSSVPLKALLVMLDACRNNPFAEIKTSGGRGLAMVDAPSGSLISYSTAPGTDALDGDGANSPYTAALLKVGREDGLPIEQALKRVRHAVNDATGKQQVPWESSSLTSEFSFFPIDAPARVTLTSVPDVNALAQAAGQVRSVDSWKKELESVGARIAYETVIREDEIAAYEAYLEAFPSDPLTALVHTVLERRREMTAWKTAVSTNTEEAYRTFLAQHGSSDYAATAARLKERPRQKRAALALPSRAARAETGSDAHPLVVDAPVVTPVYEPPRFQVRHWRLRRAPHSTPGWAHRPSQRKPAPDRPGKLAKQGKPATTARLVNSTKLANPARFANANGSIVRNVNGAASLNRITAGNRGSFGRLGGRR
jgi:uncharacterized caspase-like protein